MLLRSLYGSLSARRVTPESHLWDRGALVALSHAIEDEAAIAPGAILYALFQREACLQAQAARYTRLARRVRHLYLAADRIPDELASLPNVTAITLEPGDSWLDEWALVLLSGEGGAVLSTIEARELPGTERRRFRGFWSYDPDVLQAARRTLSLLLAERGIHNAPMPAPCYVPGIHGWDASERLTQRMVAALQAELAALLEEHEGRAGHPALESLGDTGNREPREPASSTEASPIPLSGRRAAAGRGPRTRSA